ncbi:MAG: cyclic nucleotide-binding domain-containing protein [Chloroflexi bacterium]|nr:cyclic nucleotide-binding domain-containing protein [Chloroflexota bacterium]
MATPTVDFLRHVPLFQDLDERILKEIAQAAVEQRWERGHEILRQGDTGVGLFIIRSGKVEIIQEHGGTPEKMADLGPGAVFGEMALLDEFPRSATVRAVEPTTCLAITRWHFKGILESHPEIALKMLPVLTKRIRAAEAHAHEAVTH